MNLGILNRLELHSCVEIKAQDFDLYESYRCNYSSPRVSVVLEPSQVNGRIQCSTGTDGLSTLAYDQRF